MRFTAALFALVIALTGNADLVAFTDSNCSGDEGDNVACDDTYCFSFVNRQSFEVLVGCVTSVTVYADTSCSVQLGTISSTGSGACTNVNNTNVQAFTCISSNVCVPESTTVPQSTSESAASTNGATSTNPTSVVVVSVTSTLTTSTASTASTPTSAAASNNVGAIVGGVVGGIAIIVAGIIAFLFLRRRKPLESTHSTNTTPGTIMSGAGLG